jgi:hypothetical protein
MQASPDLDVLRTAFRSTFEQYSSEGRRMAELLVALEKSTDAETLSELNRQQERLSCAQGRYEEARQKYVSYVLAGFVAPRDSDLTEA